MNKKKYFKKILPDLLIGMYELDKTPYDLRVGIKVNKVIGHHYFL